MYVFGISKKKCSFLKKKLVLYFTKVFLQPIAPVVQLVAPLNLLTLEREFDSRRNHTNSDFSFLQQTMFRRTDIDIILSTLPNWFYISSSCAFPIITYYTR